MTIHNLVQTATDEWVFQQTDAVESDVLFVFGTPHHITDLAARIHHLWLALGLRRVIISGHSGEAEALAVAAHRLGVSEKAFLLERHASNTRDNVAFSADLLRSECPHGRLHVLAKLYAAPRCLLTLRRWFPQWQLNLHVVDWFCVAPADWRSHATFRGKVTQEMIKVADYADRGDIALPMEPWTPEVLRQTASLLSQEDQNMSPPSTYTRTQSNGLGRWAVPLRCVHRLPSSRPSEFKKQY